MSGGTTVESPGATWLVELPVLDAETDALLDAVGACVARLGIAKTTASDVASQLGVSRATLYRRHPGSWEQWLRPLVQREIGGIFAATVAAMSVAGRLDDAIVAGIDTAVGGLADNAVLTHLLCNEREWVLPALLLDRASPVFSLLGDLTAPALQHLCDRETATAVGEWMVRLLAAWELDRLPGTGFTLDDAEVVRRLAVRYLLPGLVVPAGTAGSDHGPGGPVIIDNSTRPAAESSHQEDP